MAEISLLIFIFLPVIAGITILTPLFSDNQIYIRRFSVYFAILHLLFSLMFFIFGPNIDMQNTDCISCVFAPDFKAALPFVNNNVLNQIGIHISFGIDRLSVLMMILTALITTLTVIASKLYVKKHFKYFYSLVFFLETILLGIFTATDMFVFFALWELELIPMYLLISIWGNHNSKKSALKFVLYTFGGSLFLLLGILLIYFTNFAVSGVLTADITHISMNRVNLLLQLVISVFLIVGFGVKVPIFPLHKWLADTHTNAATPVSMLLAALLLKLGIYGIIRFNFGLLTLGFTVLAPILGLLAIVNVIYGAALAYYQKDIKRLVAYSSISQMGLVLLGVSSLTNIGYSGAVYHIISHALTAAGLFFIVGIIKLRFRTGNINRLSGVASIAPRLYGFSMVIILAAAGIPFLSGFIGEFLSIYGAVVSSLVSFKLYAVIGVFILILSALYLMKLVHEVFFGLLPERFKNVQDIAVHEFIVLGALSFIIILLGCFPFVIIDFLNV